MGRYQVNHSLPIDQLLKLEFLSKVWNKSKSDIIQEAFEVYLLRLNPEDKEQVNKIFQPKDEVKQKMIDDLFGGEKKNAKR